MTLSCTNIATAVQLYLAGFLNEDPYMAPLSVEFFPENTKDIDFQVKNALDRQGIAAIVSTPSLTYQGHDHEGQAYDVVARLQIAENPIVNRARMRRDGTDEGTGLDVCVRAMDSAAGPRSECFMKFCPGTIEQEESDGLVVTTGELTALGLHYRPARPAGWTATGRFAGRYEFAGEAGGVKTYIGPGGYEFKVSPQVVEGETVGWRFELTADATYMLGTEGAEMPTMVELASAGTTFEYDE